LQEADRAIDPPELRTAQMSVAFRCMSGGRYTVIRERK
jgi:hypothetical protein